MRKLLYSLLALTMLAVGAYAANNLTLTTGTQFLPGFRLVDGTDLNTVLTAVNVLRNQADGTTASSDTGTFNGTVGNVTPAAGTFTTLVNTGVHTPTGGIGPAGGFAISPRLVAGCALPARVSTDGTDATPVATEFYYVEMFVPANMTVTGVAPMNGSVASGNIKVGLANSSGVVVATSASTAMSGTDTYQLIPFTAPYAAVGPATYYALEFIDNGTARVNTQTFGTCAANKVTGQVFATGFTNFTPATTFTTALGPIANLY